MRRAQSRVSSEMRALRSSARPAVAPSIVAHLAAQFVAANGGVLLSAYPKECFVKRLERLALVRHIAQAFVDLIGRHRPVDLAARLAVAIVVDQQRLVRRSGVECHNRRNSIDNVGAGLWW